jgi:hypothetical protein
MEKELRRSLAFQKFGIRHFSNPKDKELERLVSEVLKSQNATSLWSSVVTRQGHTFQHFRIRLFGHPEDKKPGTSALETPKSQKRHIVRVGLRSYISAVRGSAFRKFQGQGARVLGVRNPKVAKHDVGVEKGCSHGGRNRIDQNFGISFRVRGIEGSRNSTSELLKSRNPKSLFGKGRGHIWWSRTGEDSRLVRFLCGGVFVRDLWICSKGSNKSLKSHFSPEFGMI